MVFDGENVKLYLQGYERERAPSEGMLYYYNSHYSELTSRKTIISSFSMLVPNSVQTEHVCHTELYY